MKLFKTIGFIACFFVLVELVSASVLINEFTVDPQQDWDNSGTITTSDEWFEFYNDGADVNITGWRLELIDTTNETEILEGVINSKSYFVIINPAGQQNNEGGLRLYDLNNNLVDAVSYLDGNADSVENECLAKIETDFVQKKCTKGYPNDIEKGNSASFLVNAVIEGSAPTIYSIAISPDDSSEEGIQISPVPNSNKTIEITVFSDGNEVYAEVLKGSDLIYGKSLNFSGYANSTKKYYGVFQMKSSDSAGNYTLKVTSSTNDGDANALRYFEYLGLIGIELDSASLTFSSLNKGETNYITGDLEMTTPDKPTIKNIGNVAINAEISGTDLQNENKSILIENLQFRFGNSNYLSLSASPVINELNLGAGNMMNLDLGLFVPELASSGTYKGAVLITAIS